jgi:hypothetical protein
MSRKTETLEFSKADFRTLEDCAAIALLGKRRTGKTSWAKYIVGHMTGLCDRFVVICGNKDNVIEWREVVPELYIHMKSIDILKKIRDWQDHHCSLVKEAGKKIPISTKIMLIIDDCGCDKSFMHSPIMKDILSNGRHYGMYIMILAQYLNQMHCVNRDQLDYIGVLHTANKRNITKLYDEYVNVNDLGTFQTVITKLTNRRGMCWIDNTQTPQSLSECLFFRKSPYPFTYRKVGGSRYRKFSQDRHLTVGKRQILTKLERKKKRQMGMDLSTSPDIEGSNNFQVTINY